MLAKLLVQDHESTVKFGNNLVTAPVAKKLIQIHRSSVLHFTNFNRISQYVNVVKK